MSLSVLPFWVRKPTSNNSDNTWTLTGMVCSVPGCFHSRIKCVVSASGVCQSVLERWKSSYHVNIFTVKVMVTHCKYVPGRAQPCRQKLTSIHCVWRLYRRPHIAHVWVNKCLFAWWVFSTFLEQGYESLTNMLPLELNDTPNIIVYCDCNVLSLKRFQIILWFLFVSVLTKCSLQRIWLLAQDICVASHL